MHGNILTPSRLVRTAAGIAPASSMTARNRTHCALCGVVIEAGDPCFPRDKTTIDGGGFLDHAAMADRHAPFLCEDCPPLMASGFLQPCMLATKDGLFKLSTNIDLASFLLAPPKDSPFVAVFANAKNQHLYWRAPVNLSPARFVIQVGVLAVDIRHAPLMRAVAVQAALLSVYADIVSACKKKVRSDYTSAIMIPDRKMKGGGEYTVVPKIREHAGETPEFSAFEAELQRLSHGEKWALAIIGHSGLQHPELLQRVLPACN